MITKLKADLAKRNIEGACDKIIGVQQYIVANRAALESKGMAAGFPAALLVTKATLETKNELQNTVRNQRKTLYDNNKLVYDALYDYIKTVAKAGKIMYKGKTKVAEYTISKIIARLRSGNDGGEETKPPKIG
jgi:ABC-type sulfate transport system substrate-binding protein